MRSLTLALVMAAAGCDPTVLSLDVRVAPDLIEVYVAEANRACTCSFGEWPAPGECADSTDLVTCDCEPGPGAHSWWASTRLRRFARSTPSSAKRASGRVDTEHSS